MGIKIWYLVAVAFIVSANGQLNDNEARYYAQLESSSPAPPTSPPPGREVVLYLTGEQVQSLQAAGAIVKPFPLYEKEFAQDQYQQQEQQEQQEQQQQQRPQYQQQQPQTQYKQQQRKPQYQEQQQYQQNDEEPTEIQFQPNTGNRDAKQEELLDEYYKELNIQQINEDLSVEPQPEEPSTEKPRPKYKYSPKLRQDYSALYVQKKANRGKSPSTEYVRYLPNYEVEELKKEPYRAQPVPGYRFNAPSNYEVQAYYHNEATKNQKNGEIRRPEQIQRIENIPIRALVINNEPRQAQQQEAPINVQSASVNKGPVTFEEKDMQYTKPRAAFRVQTPSNRWPSSIWEPAKIQESDESLDRVSTQRYQNVQIPSDGELPQRERVERPIVPSQKPSQVDNQRQFSSLAAPLDEHEKIAESIAKEKEELINNEREIHNKLKQLKESGNHDEKIYATELDNLNRNLAKQNVLAQKLALVISKKAEVSFENLEASSNRRESEKTPEKTLKQTKKSEPTKVLVSIPKPQESRTTQQPSVPSEVRPVSEQPSENSMIQSSAPTDENKRVPHPAARNVYVKVDNPFIIQKVVPVEVNHEFPVKYPNRQSAELVLRPLWEH